MLTVFAFVARWSIALFWLVTLVFFRFFTRIAARFVIVFCAIVTITIAWTCPCRWCWTFRTATSWFRTWRPFRWLFFTSVTIFCGTFLLSLFFASLIFFIGFLGGWFFATLFRCVTRFILFVTLLFATLFRRSLFRWLLWWIFATATCWFTATTTIAEFRVGRVFWVEYWRTKQILKCACRLQIVRFDFMLFTATATAATARRPRLCRWIRLGIRPIVVWMAWNMRNILSIKTCL